MSNVATSEKVRWVFDGNIERLPEKESNVVRIFISSTFTGTRLLNLCFYITKLCLTHRFSVLACL